MKINRMEFHKTKCHINYRYFTLPWKLQKLPQIIQINNDQIIKTESKKQHNVVQRRKSKIQV